MRKGFKDFPILSKLFWQVSLDIIPPIAGDSAIRGLKISLNRTFDANLHGSVIS
jgi:hypothetical protein